MKLAGVRAVLFDLDGTFADTAPDLARALNRVRAEKGLAPLPPAAARPYTSSGARGLLKAGFGITPESDSYAALRDLFLAFYEEELCVETRLFDGIPELLASLDRHRARGREAGDTQARLARAEAQVWSILADRLRAELHEPSNSAATEATMRRVAAHELDPFAAADQLLASIGQPSGQAGERSG